MLVDEFETLLTEDDVDGPGLLCMSPASNKRKMSHVHGTRYSVQKIIQKVKIVLALPDLPWSSLLQSLRVVILEYKCSVCWTDMSTEKL